MATSIDGKVKQLADNVLTLKDIRTRPDLWFKPTDVALIKNKDGTEKLVPTYIDLRIYYEWPYWTKDYNYLPLLTEHREIKKKVLQDLLRSRENTKKDGSPWKAPRENLTHDQNNDKYPQVNYYLIKAVGTTITLIFQNHNNYDLDRPNTVLFFGRNDKKIKPNLYWITNVEAIDPARCVVQVKAELDLIWRDYERFCGSWGTATIRKSTLGYFHNKHEDDEPGKDEGYSNANEKGIIMCFACSNWCFDFCSDLRNNKRIAGGKTPKEGRKELWQPKFKLGFIHSSNNKSFISIGSEQRQASHEEIRDYETNEVIVSVPTNFSLQPWEGGKTTLSKMFFSKDGDKPFLLFLLDADHTGNVDGKESDAHGIPATSMKNLWEKSQKYFFSTLPKQFNEEPHLLRHSTVLVSFKDSIASPANLHHVKIRKIDGKLKLVYQVFRKSSISGIVYTFMSSEIFYRWSLNVKGQIQNTQNLLNALLDGLFDFFGKKGDKLVSNTNLDGESSGFSWGLGKLFSALKAGIKGWLQKQCGTNINELLTGEKYEKLIGTNSRKTLSHINEEKPEQGKQVDLKMKSTNMARSKTSESSMAHADIKSLNHDFWGFANSLTNPIFQIEFQFSSVLFDNLKNNNNKTPNQNIQCKFDRFVRTMKEGEWQGKANLHYDDHGFFAGILNRGTHFVESFTNPDKMFQPWKYKGTAIQSYSFPKTSPTGSSPLLELYTPGDEGETKEGIPSGGQDNTSVEATSVYIYKTSFVRLVGSTSNLLPQIMNQIPESWFKRSESGGCWHFHGDMNTEEFRYDLPDGKYEWQVFGYDTGDPGQNNDHGKATAVCWLTGGVENGKQWGKFWVRVDIETEGTPGKSEFIKEYTDNERENEVILDEYGSSETSDLGTEGDVEPEIDLDDDKEYDEDLDFGDIDNDDADEKEEEDDYDPDADKDKDKDKDDDEEVDDDFDPDFGDHDDDDDYDPDKEKDEDEERDDDIEEDPDKDHTDKEDDQDTGAG